jgi:hypothetical protein
MINCKTWNCAQTKFAHVALDFSSYLFVPGCAHNTANVIMQLAGAQHIRLQGKSFGLLLGVVYLVGWIEDEATLHSYPPNFEPKPNEVFCGLVCYLSVTE